MDLISLGYFGMFLAAFLAATILPFSSEVVFTTLYWQHFSPFWLVFWASLGNILGGMTCYALGLLGKMEWIEKWMKIKKEKVVKFEDRIRKYGDWFAFLSFLPGVCDIIAVACGFFRCRWWVVLISMSLGKIVRYIGWMYANDLVF